MLYEICQGSMHLLLRDQVVVVENQQKSFFSLSKYVDQRCQDILEGWGMGRLQGLQQGSKAFRLLHIQCGENIGPELPRVIVLLIEGYPGHPRFAGSKRWLPSREQGGLAKASGSRDQR